VHEADQTLSGRLTGRIVSIPPGKVEDIQPWLRKVAAAERGTSVFAGEKPLGNSESPNPRGPEFWKWWGSP